MKNINIHIAIPILVEKYYPRIGTGQITKNTLL